MATGVATPAAKRLNLGPVKASSGEADLSASSSSSSAAAAALDESVSLGTVKIPDDVNLAKLEAFLYQVSSFPSCSLSRCCGCCFAFALAVRRIWILRFVIRHVSLLIRGSSFGKIQASQNLAAVLDWRKHAHFPCAFVAFLVRISVVNVVAWYAKGKRATVRDWIDRKLKKAYFPDAHA
jgi:hypothetical protein